MSGGFVLFHRSRRLVSIVTLVVIVLAPAFVKTSVSAQTYSQQELVNVVHALIYRNSAQWQVDARQLKVAKVVATNDGLTTVRFTQVVADVPVANSLVAVTLLSDGTYLSHVSKVSSASALSPARISSNRASQIALTAFNSQHHLSDGLSSVIDVSDQLADPVLVDFISGEVQRVWQVKIQNPNHPQLASIVFISDLTQKALVIRQMSRAFSEFPMPYVCDLQKSKPSKRFAKDISTKRIRNQVRKYIGKADEYPLCEKSDPARITKSSAASVKAIAETVDYFRNKIGVDIADERYLGNIAPYANFGKSVSARSFCTRYPKSRYCVATISGYTNVCAYNSQNRNVDCPLENAFWVPWSSSECHSGACSGIFFGAGYDKASDVVAHELAHGVTGSDAFPTGLCDSCDAGSISEALSDFFGEAVDQLNVAPGESADPDWNMGEDINGGSFRNLAMVGDANSCDTANDWVPIKQLDDNWDSMCDPHTNLGPADRFAWLVSNGGNQNGIDVAPIGTAPWSTDHVYELCNSTGSNCTATVNMTRLAFQVMAKLNGNIAYNDFGIALNQACTDLTKARKNPFPSSYCDSVRNALSATGIRTLEVTNVTRASRYTGVPVAIAANFGSSNSVAGADVPMRILFRTKGSQFWQTLDIENTSSTGDVKFTVTFPGTGTYRVATVPSNSVGTYSSAIYSVS